MRFSIFLLFLFSSSAFSGVLPLGVINPNNKKNYYVHWGEMGGWGSCSYRRTIGTDWEQMLIIVVGPNIGDPDLDDCQYKEGRLVLAPDCEEGKEFYTDGGCYTRCPTDPTKIILETDGQCHNPPRLDYYDTDWEMFKEYAKENPAQVGGFGLSILGISLFVGGFVAPDILFGSTLMGLASLLSIGLHSVLGMSAVLASLPSPTDPKITFPIDSGVPRFKVTLIDYKPSPTPTTSGGGATSGGKVTIPKNDSSGSNTTAIKTPSGTDVIAVDSSGRPTAVVTVPDKVVSDLQNTPIDYTSDVPPVPSPSTPLDGLQQTTYNYDDMTATTTTHTSGSTVGNPMTSTVTAPITTVQNADGTTTTQSISKDVPNASGSGGGSITKPSVGSLAPAGGGSPAPAGDYSGQLGQIISNTNNLNNINGDKNPDFDAMSKAGLDSSLQDTLTNSIERFQSVSDLGLGDSCGQISDITFDYKGEHFVLFGQQNLSSLPLDFIRGLLWFFAALFGLFSVFISGV